MVNGEHRSISVGSVVGGLCIVVWVLFIWVVSGIGLLDLVDVSVFKVIHEGVLW